MIMQKDHGLLRRGMEKFIRKKFRASVMWVPVTMEWHVLRLPMKETASRCGR